MRGVEAAFLAWAHIERGAFAPEALRAALDNVTQGERKLASSLVYMALRKLSLWKELIRNSSRRPFHELKPVVRTALVLGTAGMTELRHFVPGVLMNALAKRLEAEGCAQDIPFLYGVLHDISRKSQTAMEKLKNSAQLHEIALYYGMPGWIASLWKGEIGHKETKRLLKCLNMRNYMSLAVKPDMLTGAIDAMTEAGMRAWASPILQSVIRTPAHGHPPFLPGFDEGIISPQTESSVMVCELLLSMYGGGYVLDMCAGRGVKTAYLAARIDAPIEAWDTSDGKVRAAKKNLARMGVRDNVNFKTCNAVSYLSIPGKTPSVILLDAPCSGSGTWGRHPEGKWRINSEKIEEYSGLQISLLNKALDILEPGGKVIYSTCSLFRKENESVVGAVLGKRSDAAEIPVPIKNKYMKRSKPYGAVIWPALPWIDGFYTAVLTKRQK